MKVLTALFVFLSSLGYSQPTTSEYYEAFLSNDRAKMKTMDGILKKLQQNGQTRALRGALQAKIAMSEKDKSDQVRNFNMGKEMLEKQCRDNKENIEFRFLRLCVQTFCNDSRYNENVLDDKTVIMEGFSELDSDLKNIIRSYAKTSAVFKDEVFD